MRHFRNFIIISGLVIGILLLALYVASVLFTTLVWGPDYVTPNPSMIVDFLIARGFWFWWLYRTQITASYNDFYIPKLIFSMIVPFGSLAAFAYIFRAPLLDFRPYRAKESLHGDAKWATEAEVKKAGLRSKEGMLMGKDKKGFFIAGGYQHALLFAPTGSGKGVGFVIPNLLFWKDSVIVHDIKLENHEITSGWRAKQGQKVFVWSPAEPDGITHCYNPIDWVSKKPGQMVDDVQKIANLILPEKEFWNNEARSLFVGVVLYLLAVPEKIKSFGEVVRTLRSDDVVYNLAVVLDTIGKQIHPVAYMNIAAFLQKADKERSGVVSTLNSGLELWANPLIDTATATSDFNVQLFKKERTTVYVGLTPDNIQRLEPLMQVFYQQASEFLSRKIPKKNEEPYGVLFMLDEFPTLGKMEQFLSGIAYFRGYNVRLFLIIQDTQQLKGTYEEPGMNTFLSNSTFRITFSANNIETAKLISELCGNKTVEQASQSKPKFLDLNPASRSLNVSDVSRALLLPQEVITLPRDDQIVLVESCSPIRSKKIKYYADPFFVKRLLPPTPIPVQEPFDPRKLQKEDIVVDDAPPQNETFNPPPMPMDYNQEETGAPGQSDYYNNDYAEHTEFGEEAEQFVQPEQFVQNDVNQSYHQETEEFDAFDDEALPHNESLPAENYTYDTAVLPTESTDPHLLDDEDEFDDHATYNSETQHEENHEQAITEDSNQSPYQEIAADTPSPEEFNEDEFDDHATYNSETQHEENHEQTVAKDSNQSPYQEIAADTPSPEEFNEDELDDHAIYNSETQHEENHEQTVAEDSNQSPYQEIAADPPSPEEDEKFAFAEFIDNTSPSTEELHDNNPVQDKTALHDSTLTHNTAIPEQPLPPHPDTTKKDENGDGSSSDTGKQSW